MTDLLIELSSIEKDYETEDVITQALKGIDFKIYAGDYFCITGPSGCGKSTLLSILGLLDQPTRGSYLIEGKDVSTLSMDELSGIRNRQIGFIFQSFNLIDELSVFNNVALPLRYSEHKKNPELIEQKVTQCLELVGLSHRIHHRPNQLSGGQQQRVAIARALVNDPAILLVDEPTGNLDSTSGDQIMDLIGELNQQGRTICMVTHDPRYADRAKTQLRLLDGVIAQATQQTAQSSGQAASQPQTEQTASLTETAEV